jgi:tRNA(fMet)-specific endonuclease VapC
LKKPLLDSGNVSDPVNRRREIPAKISDFLASGIKVGTCVPVIAEIVAGIECSLSRERNMKAFIAVLPALTVWPFDNAAAFRYGQIFSDLRKNGRPMQVVAMMLSAVAFNLGNCVVITTDSDLKAIPGLKVEIW